MRLEVTVRLKRAEARERTRRELLAAAARVFAERGFSGASVDDVAEAAGYTKGAVYSNFASKTDLMLALIEDRIRRQSELVEETFAGIGLEEGLREMDRRAAGSPASVREWMMIAGEFMLYALRDERARVALADEYERARDLSAALIAQKYAESGATPPLPPRDIAILIESLGIGVGFQALIDPQRVSLGLQSIAVERILRPAEGGPRSVAAEAEAETDPAASASPVATADRAASVGTPASAPSAPEAG